MTDPYTRLVTLCDALLAHCGGQPSPLPCGDDRHKDIIAGLKLTPGEKRAAALLALEKLGIEL